MVMGVEEWLFKIEQFFLLDKILEQSKITIVSLHLEDCVLHWHKSYLKLMVRMHTWEEYVIALHKRFGLPAYEDPMADIKKLKQTGTLQEYLREFDLLLNKAQLTKKIGRAHV